MYSIDFYLLTLSSLRLPHERKPFSQMQP